MQRGVSKPPGTREDDVPTEGHSSPTLPRGTSGPRSTDLNSSWMAGSTGTAEGNRQTRVIYHTHPLPLDSPKGWCQGSSQGEPSKQLLQDEGDPTWGLGGLGACGRTSNPFGPCAMTLLLGIHLHLGIDEQAVSVPLLQAEVSRHVLCPGLLVTALDSCPLCQGGLCQGLREESIQHL